MGVLHARTHPRATPFSQSKIRGSGYRHLHGWRGAVRINLRVPTVSAAHLATDCDRRWSADGPGGPGDGRDVSGCGLSGRYHLAAPSHPRRAHDLRPGKRTHDDGRHQHPRVRHAVVVCAGAHRARLCLPQPKRRRNQPTAFAADSSWRRHRELPAPTRRRFRHWPHLNVHERTNGHVR